MRKCEVCGKPLEVAEIDYSAKLIWFACPAGGSHTSYSEPLKQKWLATLLDAGGQPVPGYELRLEGSRPDVTAAYLYWLEAVKGREGVNEKDVHLEPLP
ncbi:MAG: hypothetical protein K6T29_04715 [Peptococcaceae bacterium]|nr:hypothetical protein [Peptococcaceae bacterium]